MAKLTAGGKHAVSRLRVRTPGDTILIYALRSDGKVLRRFTGDLADGYSIAGQIRMDLPLTEETLRKLMQRMDYEVLEVLR